MLVIKNTFLEIVTERGNCRGQRTRASSVPPEYKQAYEVDFIEERRETPETTSADSGDIDFHAELDDHHIVEPTLPTSMMIRNIPNNITQVQLMNIINEWGFLNAFDFLYLPMDSSRGANRGYAFINFLDGSMAAFFKKAFDGVKLRNIRSKKAVLVTAAQLQGYEANVAFYASKIISNAELTTRPLFREQLLLLQQQDQPVMNVQTRVQPVNDVTVSQHVSGPPAASSVPVTWFAMLAQDAPQTRWESVRPVTTHTP
jgi:RNA recognition motif-containing protein